MNRPGRNLSALGGMALASRHLAYPLAKWLHSSRALKIRPIPAQTTAAAQPASFFLPGVYESKEAEKAAKEAEIRADEREKMTREFEARRIECESDCMARIAETEQRYAAQIEHLEQQHLHRQRRMEQRMLKKETRMQEKASAERREMEASCKAQIAAAEVARQKDVATVKASCEVACQKAAHKEKRAVQELVAFKQFYDEAMTKLEAAVLAEATQDEAHIKAQQEQISSYRQQLAAVQQQADVYRKENQALKNQASSYEQALKMSAAQAYMAGLAAGHKCAAALAPTPAKPPSPLSSLHTPLKPPSLLSGYSTPSCKSRLVFSSSRSVFVQQDRSAAAQAVDSEMLSFGFVSSMRAGQQLHSCMAPAGQQKGMQQAQQPLPSSRLLFAASRYSNHGTDSSSAGGAVAEVCVWQQQQQQHQGWAGGWGHAAATQAAGYGGSGSIWGGAVGAQAAAGDGSSGGQLHSSRLYSVWGGGVAGGGAGCGWAVSVSPIGNRRGDADAAGARDCEVPKSSMMQLFLMPSLL